MEKILSIIIPIYNKWGFTKSCLNDLSKLPNDHEIIIYDNGSVDETKYNLENNKEIIYIRSEENKGFARANNIAYSYSTAPNVLFLNNDIRVKDDYSNWTDIIIQKCNNGLVGPTMGQLDNKFNFIKEANESLSGKSYMSGWCLASSKKNWNKLNFPRPRNIDQNIPQIFSEEFFAYFEDTDLSFRAKKLGIKFKIVEVPIVHFKKQTSCQLNTYKLYKESREIFIKKWTKFQ